MKLRSRITLFQLGRFYKWPLIQCMAWALFYDRRYLKDGKPTMKKLLILPLIALASCATIQTYLGSAQEVQQEVALLAALAKPYVPASDVPLVHSFAVGLAQNTNPLPPPPPVTGHPKTDALIKAAIAFVDLAIAKYGGTTGLDYQHAAGNGLLSSF